MKKSVFSLFILVILTQLCLGQAITLVPDNPANPTKGTLNFDNVSNLLRYWNGSAWIPITNAASGTGWLLNGNNISNNNSGNVGIGISNPKAALNVAAGKTVIFGDSAGPGSKFVWYGSKAAFRAGYNFLSEFDNANVGAYSTGFGSSPTASGLYSTAIGSITTATGSNSMAFGTNTTASGDYSTAMGIRASTNNYTNSFCINGASNNQTASNTTDYQMMMRFDNYTFWISSSNYAYLTPASNGWAYTSDVRKKENFQELDGENVLKKIAAIPFYSWNFKAKETKQYRHYGIMAQDFYQAFGKDNYGAIGNDTTVNALDLLGVAYSGIKALEKRTEALQMQNQQLMEELALLKSMLQPKRRRYASTKTKKVLTSEKVIAKK